MATPEMVSYFADQLSEQVSRGVRNSVTLRTTFYGTEVVDDPAVEGSAPAGLSGTQNYEVGLAGDEALAVRVELACSAA